MKFYWKKKKKLKKNLIINLWISNINTIKKNKNINKQFKNLKTK